MKNWFNNNLKIILIGIIIFLILLLGNTFYNTSKKVFISSDSIKVLTNCNKELYSQINTYQITESQLKKVNSDLYNELKKNKEKTLSIEKVNSTINTKDLKLNTIVKDSLKNYSIIWSKDSIYTLNNSIHIVGISSFNLMNNNILNCNTVLKQLLITNSTILSETIKDQQLHLNVLSDYPNTTYSKIEGFNTNSLPTKVKRFGLSVFIGVTYELKPAYGAGISYSLIRF